jgi:simple sugar transport system permease protein
MKGGRSRTATAARGSDPLRRYLARVVWEDLQSTILRPIVSVVLAIVFGAVILLSIGVNPLAAYGAIVHGAFGSRVSLADTLLKTAPLILAGLGVLVAFRAGLFNVGAEGQIYVGAIAATVVALAPLPLPGGIVILLSMLAALGAGAAWSGAAGLLRVKRGVNEVVTTLLLNFVAIYLTGLLVGGPLKDPHGAGYPQSARIPAGQELPILLPRTSLHVGLLVGVAAAGLLYFLLWYSTWGFEVRAVGRGPETARLAGIHLDRVLMSTMLVSGALAGLAGGGEVLGFHHRLFETVSPGYGYTALVVALLARLHPLGVILTSVFFGDLLTGGNEMQRTVGAPIGIVFLIQAFTIMFLVAGSPEGIRRRGLRRRLPIQAAAEPMLDENEQTPSPTLNA